MSFLLAKNYTNYNDFPIKTNSVPYKAIVPPLGYLFANWQLDESQKEGLLYVHASTDCHNTQINKVSTSLSKELFCFL